MSDAELFEQLPEQASPERRRGRPRLLEPERDQIAMRAVDLDSLLAADHPARVIWSYVMGLALGELEDAIEAREGEPGHPAIAPKLLLALWLFATSDGVGSARALARLCESHDTYRWLCGGVSVNHHTLGDFRVEHGALLERLLIENVAALAQAGVISLDALTQDGIRVRASAGASSFRRAARLEEHLAAAQERVARLKDELHDDPHSSNKSIVAARERAARERVERVAAAQAALAAITSKRTEPQATKDTAQSSPDSQGSKNTKDKKRQPRASTTDAQARVMKMADGGFRPAYNVQVVSPKAGPFVVTLDVETNGSDRGLIRPAAEDVQAAHGPVTSAWLADAGFTSAKDIEWAHDRGIAIYCPPIKSKHGTDPYAVRKDDGPGAQEWRGRMASDAGKQFYKDRAICECIHGRWRQWNLHQLTVRGITKVKAVLLWYAIANNILQAHRVTQA
jgi:transposase